MNGSTLRQLPRRRAGFVDPQSNWGRIVRQLPKMSLSDRRNAGANLAVQVFGGQLALAQECLEASA